MSDVTIDCCAPLAAPAVGEAEAAATAELFKALADPARVRIVNMLATGGDAVCVCNLTAPLGLSQPTVSHHLKRLLDAGLVERKQRGKWAYFSLQREAAEKLAAVADLKGACCGYGADERGELPPAAVHASPGCGNPTAVADLREGETVLDLGSGGGIDVILSAKRVGPTGRVFGLDLTDEMLALARANAVEANAANAIFVRGAIEDVPLPAGSVDVVISNCVINLSRDRWRC